MMSSENKHCFNLFAKTRIAMSILFRQINRNENGTNLDSMLTSTFLNYNVKKCFKHKD